MSETKHTPGPWFSDGGCVVGGFGEDTFNSVEDEGYFKPANARLMSAAPDLLEVAKTLVEALAMLGVENWTDAGHLDIIARRAIAKADGR